MRILFLSAWYPYPPNNGSKLRIYNLLRGLARHHDVTLLSFAQSADVDTSAPELQRLCATIETVPWKSFTPDSWRARMGFFSTSPRAVVDTFSPEMAHSIGSLLSETAFDLVIASEIRTAGYARYFRDVPAVFEDVELGVLYEQFAAADSVWDRFRYRLTWAKHSHYLRRLLDHFRACTVVSDHERHLLRQVVNGQHAIEVIPNCVDLPSYNDVEAVAQPNTLIFTGSFTYSANYDAMTWFLRDIYPLVRREIPDVEVTITGDHADLPLPPADNVTLTGFVDDVRPLIASSWISLAPIRIGAGTRLKILEGMALRTPVVATSKGAEGLDVRDGEHLLIADSPEQFANATIRLLKQPDLREKLAENAYRRVKETYDWNAVMPHFLELVEQVAATRQVTLMHKYKITEA